ncbi:MAG: hypothetical protein WHU94_09320 [Thermogemmata sp.]|nr:hypothetical protein [Thermogemmata fonticola]MCX8140643.1 hypothetical protein [Gemmataceae bacterium]
MAEGMDRRDFLASSAMVPALPFLGQLPAVAAQEARLQPQLVRFEESIEPLVRLIEETPADRLLEEVAGRIKKGMSYRQLLAALFLAGVRNIPPRPNVGFKFHAVLVIHSAHQAALAGPDRDRWLPLFWCLDYFKRAQGQAIREGGWRMKPVAEGRVPTAEQAQAAFREAMTRWDEEAADGAAAALARHVPVHEAFELFAHFAARDFRDIGHKIIYVANAFRTLEVIGHQHAEPIYRSLAFALLRHEGKNPAQHDLPADRPGRRTQEALQKQKASLAEGAKASPAEGAAVRQEVLEALRRGSDADLFALVWDALFQRRVAPAVLWEALHLGAAELLMRQPGIVSLHTLTSLNAFHYAFRTSHDRWNNRAWLLLQAASFLPLFRESMKNRGPLGEARIDTLAPAEASSATAPEAIFAALSRDKLRAAQQALAFLQNNPTGIRDLSDEARRWIFLKGNDAHDYKFSSAVLEDTELMSPGVRERFLAASLFWLKGADAADSPVVRRTRAALG